MIKVNSQDLTKCVTRILLAFGESETGSGFVSECLVRADSRGISTHGSYLLHPISDRVLAGQLSLPTKISIIFDSPTIAIIDGGNGLGPIAGKFAVDLSIERASHYGISLVLIRNTNNLGSLANYTELVAKQGMVGLMGCNAAPAMAPWGGAEAFIGTNPIAMAFCLGNGLLFSADLATSVIARGKIRKAAREGQSIPDNWALDADGNATTNAKAALEGTLLPMGGPKGSAIALFVDVIAGILSGSQYGPDIKSFHTPSGKTGVGAALMAIDIQKVMSLDEFSKKIKAYFQRLKKVKLAKGVSEIFIPGEIEQRKEITSNNEGINLDDKTYEKINSLMNNLGLKGHLECIQ